MRTMIFSIGRIGLLVLTACAPTFNWRETSIAATSLVALFPCKPKAESRVVVMGGHDVELHMTGCDVAGVTLAVGHAKMTDPKLVELVLAQWRMATLAGMHVNTSVVSALRLAGANVMPQPVLVKATGVTPDGRALALNGAWFARDTEVFVALLYGGTLSADVIEAFFSGLQFR